MGSEDDFPVWYCISWRVQVNFRSRLVVEWICQGIGRLLVHKISQVRNSWHQKKREKRSKNASLKSKSLTCSVAQYLHDSVLNHINYNWSIMPPFSYSLWHLMAIPPISLLLILLDYWPIVPYIPKTPIPSGFLPSSACVTITMLLSLNRQSTDAVRPESTRRGSGGIADLQASLDRSCLGMCCAESWGAAGEGEQLLLFLDNEC